MSSPPQTPLLTLLLQIEANQRKKITIKRSWNWEEADISEFHSTTEDILTTHDISLLDPSDAISTLNYILSSATLAAVPVTELKIGGPRRGQPQWTAEFKAAEEASKIAHHEWKCAGKPTDHPLQDRTVNAKKTVRRVQRVAAAVERSKLLAEMSSAAAWDRQLLSKLVARQRPTSSRANGLLIDGILINNEDDILEAWA